MQLKGEQKPGPEEASLHQLSRLVSTHAVDTLFQLQLISPSPPNEPTPSAISWLEPLLNTYTHPFTKPKGLPLTPSTDHSIPILHAANHINVRPFHYLYFQKQEIEAQIREMLSQGIIRPSCSAFSSPVLLVRKKDGTWRFCIDYKALNAITGKEHFPILTIDQLLDELYGIRWFSKLDLRSGFNQISMDPSNIHKTTFRTHQGHYEFRVMPFGLCNAPSTFHSTMNLLFQPYLRRLGIVFFDDILVYSCTLEDHRSHLEIVFQCLVDNNFF